METYEGAARLEWWANRETSLSSVNIRVVVVSDDSGWRASATFVSPPTAEEREAWMFLLTLSPYFDLRFDEDEDAVIEVRVEEVQEGRLSLVAA